MSQNPLALIYLARHFNPTKLPGTGGLKTTTLTEATVLKTGVGYSAAVQVQNLGTTSGAFTINDAASVGTAAASNQLLTIPYTATGMLGEDITFVVKFSTGLVLSAVPGGGSPSIKISYI